MHLLIDIGNTSVKWRVADKDWSLVDSAPMAASPDFGYEEWASIASNYNVADAVISASGAGAQKFQEALRKAGLKAYIMDEATPLPIKIDYNPRSSLGSDRVAVAVGAWQRCRKACLAIDAGTCVTADFIDEDGMFCGGAIMPGIGMQLQAMHQHTARLPMVDYCGEAFTLAGRSTREAMLAGTLGATSLALMAMADRYRTAHEDMQVFFTGGDAPYIASQLDGAYAHYCPDLLFEGMSAIMRKNYGNAPAEA